MSRDLGLVTVLGADAVGQPGQRRFRLFVKSRRGSAIIWVEKELLNSLSLAVDRFLAQLTEGQVLRTEARAGAQVPARIMPADFPTEPTYEFQAGEMALDYDELRETFVIRATPLEIVIEDELESQVQMQEDAAVSFVFTQQDAQELSRSIAGVLSAGRPVCPLCGTPLDGGPHACVKQNGHREILQIEEGDEEE